MSDFYLVLRHKLAEVAHASQWVAIDGQVLIEARARKGLSREALAAIIRVASKTVERYEKQGRLPRALLPQFAAALDLEVEETPALKVEASPIPGRVRLHDDELVGRLERMERQLERIERLLEDGQHV